MGFIKSIFGNLLDWAGLANVPAALTALSRLKGNPGQIISISAADAEGAATDFEAVDKPAGGADSGQNVVLTTAQITALHGMFKVCLFDDSKDVDGAISAFEAAFGISDSGDDTGGGDTGGEDSGGSAGGALPTNGLVDFFDFRNKASETNESAGLTWINSDIGNGMIYQWVKKSAISDDVGTQFYGAYTTERASAYPVPESKLAGDCTIAFYGSPYSTNMGMGVGANLSDQLFLSELRYVCESGDSAVTKKTVVYGNRSEGSYHYIVYVYSGTALTVYVDGEIADQADGAEIDGFANWSYDIKAGTIWGNKPTMTAMAVYDRALSDVEMTELWAYYKTLEVTA